MKYDNKYKSQYLNSNQCFMSKSVLKLKKQQSPQIKCLLIPLINLLYVDCCKLCSFKDLGKRDNDSHNQMKTGNYHDCCHAVTTITQEQRNHQFEYQLIWVSWVYQVHTTATGQSTRDACVVEHYKQGRTVSMSCWFPYLLVYWLDGSMISDLLCYVD